MNQIFPIFLHVRSRLTFSLFSLLVFFAESFLRDYRCAKSPP